MPEGFAGATDAAAECHAFFERRYAELCCLADLLTGDSDGADGLAADALRTLWHRRDRVRAADHPVAYARGVVANMARSRSRSRSRSVVRERRRITLSWSGRDEGVADPDVPAVVDVREVLRALPFRKRACVVLRHARDDGHNGRDGHDGRDDTPCARSCATRAHRSDRERMSARVERGMAEGRGRSSAPSPPARRARPDCGWWARPPPWPG
nr:SigE family RNA polymerase sigma factor [Streptomyces atriruber]